MYGGGDSPRLALQSTTVRRRLHRFDKLGFDGLSDRAKPGRPRRLTMVDDSKLITLVRKPPSGRLVTREDDSMVARDEEKSAQWSLDALELVAKEAGIVVRRSQIRRILLREKVRWCYTHSWSSRTTRTLSQKSHVGAIHTSLLRGARWQYITGISPLFFRLFFLMLALRWPGKFEHKPLACIGTNK